MVGNGPSQPTTTETGGDGGANCQSFVGQVSTVSSSTSINGASKIEDHSSVRVALRIRPPLPRELINGSQICTSVTPGVPQVWIGTQHAFTYDVVYDTTTEQAAVFDEVRGLIEGCLEGYNATILAYGQTGSGKTYTMGTGFDIENIDSGMSIMHGGLMAPNQGIVPRAVHYLFELIRRKQSIDDTKKPTFKVSVQFIELYNEEIIDLVGGQQSNKIRRRDGPPNSANQKEIKIHEDASGGIYLAGVGTQIVHSAEETMKCLRNGALVRTTAATNMNDQSSRSHAIFSIHIDQQRPITDQLGSMKGTPDFESLTAKFHFVDLAGSERLKRTGAVGDRAKEGIAINSGLLALGNVISALGDKSKKASHIPYRDAKLTRLLTDSLGGNSRTVMIACVSPCDADLVETLNTLKYANRARNIKNKVTINQDKTSRIIAELKERIKELEEELLEFRQGRRSIDPKTGEETLTEIDEADLIEPVPMEPPTKSRSKIHRILSHIDKTSDEDNDEYEEDEDDTEEAEGTNFIEGDEFGNYPELTELSNDISSKQKLIEQLEATQQRMEVMKQKYEEKLQCLASKISATETERDKLLQSTQSQPSIDKIKAEYEKKLSAMKNDMKNWQQAHREHQKVMKSEAEKCKQIDKLRIEVDKMKQAKVKLMNQIKADSVKFRNLDSARVKEIAQLKKEQRKKDNAIFKLTSEKNAKEGILKRKHEEINHLKNKLRPQINKTTAGKNFSPIKAKQKWAALQLNLVKTIKQEQSLETCESEMLQVIENRKQLKTDLEERQQALLTSGNADERNKLLDEIDSINESLAYNETRLKELQGQVLSNNEEELDVNFEAQVQRLNREECVYLMKKMHEYCRENLGSVHLFEKRVKLLEMENAKLSGDLGIIKELYHHLYTNYTNKNENGDTTDGSNAVNHFVRPECLESFGTCSDDLSLGTNSKHFNRYMNNNPTNPTMANSEEKARRLTSAPSQLLGTSTKPNNVSASAAPAMTMTAIPVLQKSVTADNDFVNPNDIAFKRVRSERRRRQKFQEKESPAGTSVSVVSAPATSSRDMKRDETFVLDWPNPTKTQVHAASDGETEKINGNNFDFDKVMTNYDKKLQNNEVQGQAEEEDAEANVLSDTTFIVSPPTSQHGSPQAAHKSASTTNSNVFQRLTSQTTIEERVPKGSIKSLRPTSRGIVYNSHVAEGHQKAVHSIFATETRLYTGGKESAIRIWDLNTKTETQTLQANTTGKITAIQCSNDENLVFAANWSSIRVFDRRINGKKCVKVLLSSGIETDDVPPTPSTNLVPNGENEIQALAVTKNTLFSTCGDRVRVWDIRKFTNFGLLKGIHNSNVMCLAAEQGDRKSSMLVTGSKDHRIKVYDFRSNESIISTAVKYTLDPPHYDGIQSLALSNGTLFSGSRDCCIKRWDLSGNNDNLLVQSLNNAHKDWITGLAFAPSNHNYILSVSRDGYMKLWSVGAVCTEIDKYEVNKGKAVECIATNSNFAFTGSSDGKVGFWKARSQDALPSNASPDNSFTSSDQLQED